MPIDDLNPCKLASGGVHCAQRAPTAREAVTYYLAESAWGLQIDLTTEGSAATLPRLDLLIAGQCLLVWDWSTLTPSLLFDW